MSLPQAELAAPPAAVGPFAGPPAHRPTWAEVDLAAIRHNVAELRRAVAPAAVIAVVKADAYGHGLVPVARAAVEAGAGGLAVALVEEGMALRAAGISARVLVLTEPPRQAIRDLLAHDLTPTGWSPRFVGALDVAAAALRRRVGVHVKLDTGMHRVGAPEAAWEQVLTAVRDSRALVLEGLWSHLAAADDPTHPATDAQAGAFRRGLDLAASLGMSPSVAHLCGSAGALLRPELRFGAVRAGLATYGLSPTWQAEAAGVRLRPALALYSQLTHVRSLAAGESVSYGHTWTARHATTVGVVPIGYADGVPWALSNTGAAVVGGRRVPIAGRVCMDQTVLDLGPGTDARAGDTVALVRGGTPEEVTLEHWAEWAGTITYEVAARLGPRVPRVVVDGPRPDSRP